MKILVGIGGGSGSFCAAKILLEQGNDVTGAFVSVKGSDAIAAAAAASAVGVPLIPVSASGEGDVNIVAALLDYAGANGFDAVATGHICEAVSEGNAHIKTALSAGDDESYSLCLLSREMISKLKLPLSSMTAEQVSEYASSYGYDGVKAEPSCVEANAVSARAIRIKDVALQRFDNPSFNLGFSGYMCGCSAKCGATDTAVKSHVYPHLLDEKLVADVIFFEDNSVVIGEKVAVYNESGEIMLGGVCEFVQA